MSPTQATTSTKDQHDRKSELKSFDESKLGVKGLVDSGLSKVPCMFVNNLDHNRPEHEPSRHHRRCCGWGA